MNDLTETTLIAEIERDVDAMKILRRDIHAHPELAFEETRTSALVAERLTALGLEVHRGLVKTGVVGVLRGTGPATGRSLGLRAPRSHALIMCIRPRRVASGSSAAVMNSRASRETSHLRDSRHIRYSPLLSLPGR